MSAKEDPLAIKVVCKACNLIQTYRGQIRCIHCGEQGSLQLQPRKEVVQISGSGLTS
jgi:hypothetical protein